MRVFERVVGALLLGVTLVLTACGGGGSTTPPKPPPPNPLFVRASGNDNNDGGGAATALRTISKAAQIARSGYTILVGPGTYPGTVTTDRPGQKVPDGVVFVADVQGTETEDRPGPVIVDAQGSGPGFSLSNTGPATVGNRTSNPTIDGFTVINSTDAGIVVKGTLDFVIQDCVVSNGSGDGIRVQNSADTLVFNNLLYRNDGAGIGITRGSNNARVFNNTITLNGVNPPEGRAVTVGNANEPSNGALIRSNIMQANGEGAGGEATFKIFQPGDANYLGGFNLVLPDSYNPTSIRRIQDIHVDARFVDSNQDNFALRPNSPALNGGIAPKEPDGMGGFVDLKTVDRLRDPLSVKEVTLTDFLGRRSATGDNNCDTGQPDMGFHAPPPNRCTGS